MSSNDDQLTRFVDKTGADQSLARDLLVGSEWNFVEAMKVFEALQHASPPGSDQRTAAQHAHCNPATHTNGTEGPPGPGEDNPRAPRLEKMAAVDVHDAAGKCGDKSQNTGQKQLKRGISKAIDNCLLVDEARQQVLTNITEWDEVDNQGRHLVETPEFTFVLPDLTVYEAEFRAFLERDLIETSTLVSLEQAGRLNWWAETGACQRLLPMATSGDGNCLLHAASLGMWGFHDRQLTLRGALYDTLRGESHGGAFRRRWRWQQTQINKQSGLIYDESEWQREWDCLLNLASSDPRTLPGRPNSCCDSPATRGSLDGSRMTGGQSTSDYYESLEEIHVFVLAHVLHRPIIVIADVVLKDSDGQPLAPIPFGGVYLPLECDPKKCSRSPLLLTYDAAHFSALVAMDTNWTPGSAQRPPALIPVIGPDFDLSPLHLAVDPGTRYEWESGGSDLALELTDTKRLELLEQYMDLGKVPLTSPDIVTDSTKPEVTMTMSDNTNLLDRKSSSSSEGSEAGKEKGKQSAKQSVQSVAKRVGKNIKKNFGNMGKAIKNIGNHDNKYGRLPMKASVSQVVQRALVVTPEVLHNHSHIVVAALQYKPSDFQQSMVKNYLAAARGRFEEERTLRPSRGQEGKRVTDRTGHPEPTPCPSQGCSLFGTPATNYLCTACYNSQKRRMADMQIKAPTLLHRAELASLPGDRNDPQLGLPNDGTLVQSGKSKFYTPTENTDQIAGGPANQRGLVPHNTMNVDNSKFYASAPYRRSPDGSRSTDVVQSSGVKEAVTGSGWTSIPVHSVEAEPSDNSVPRNAHRTAGGDGLSVDLSNRCAIGGSRTSDAGQVVTVVYVDNGKKKCRTANCDFFGASENDRLCSKCFQAQQPR